MELNNKLDELIVLIDNDINKHFNNSNKTISKELEILINEYKNNRTSSNKEKLYQNNEFKDINDKVIYINYLIMNINNRFKVLRSNKCE